MNAQRGERGNYFVLFALAIVVVFGFGALAADVSFMRASQSQAQDVADAASQAAAVVLKRTGDVTQATAVAQKVIALNRVAGEAPVLEEIDFGVWSQGAADLVGTFDTAGARPNSVRVRVGRRDTRSIPFLLATIFGYHQYGVAATATSASRNVHVVLALDITESWAPANFDYARAAAVTFLDTMRASAGPYDQLGMTVFTGRFAWEFTPFVSLRDEAAVTGVRSKWTALRKGSRAGNGTAWPSACSLNASPNTNNFGSPAGGCYPNMPRMYSDELGTDHTTGLEMAATMFDENVDPSAERVLVVLTDGIPQGISSGAGAIRAGQGYVEPRWREYKGPVPHTTAQIQADSVALCQEMWADMHVHTYVVSFVQDGAFLHDMPQGQGYFVLTNSASALVPIFQQIANALPMAIVE